jgi:5-methylcytosine-specific restriction endonuclease McrA
MPYPTRGCPRCAKPYASSQSACADCLNAARRAKRAAKIALRPTIPCVSCGTQFIPATTRNNACSSECSKVHAKRLRGTPELVEGACSWCSAAFMPAKSTSRHCSVHCKERERHSVRSRTAEYQEYKRRYHAAYHAHNRPQRIEAARIWRESNRDLHRQLCRAWLRANRERAAASAKAWAVANPTRRNLKEHRRRAQKIGTQVHAIDATNVTEKMDYWGGKCWMCSRPADTLDHVKPLAAGGYHMLANLRPACRSCNSSKGAKWFGPESLSKFIRL